ncbi:relaxase/mobilization nuclease domain-containing protein [Foetidibacter luteolus]|uniref:relaxase/mobilization nuclease domain-containing protein n=1 Tax=Foetidibacter luteolus TaxID=2608880 RepID=UPI00129B01EC|nr:relaxase/mobilization nuclease domain-containing protein [Foetidibacter luteolus]
MVAVVNDKANLRNAIHYNENKLKEGQAKLILAGNYAKDTERLGFTDKYMTLKRRNDLNDRVIHNTLHISINFETNEKIPEDKLKEIAAVYMQKIGFGDQPYLVYQHFDAAHPHLHLVTTAIHANGKRLPLHNLAKNQSSKARREIEKEFNLVVADDHKQKETYRQKAIDAKKLVKGKSQVKRSITNALDFVLDHYQYTSLAELNAILKQFNVQADRGGENSRIYKNNGLVYRALNDEGTVANVKPIKASDFYNKPTLAYLEEKFLINKQARQDQEQQSNYLTPSKRRIKNVIDLAFKTNATISIEKLSSTLKKEQIDLVIRQNDNGLIYGLTYVDHDKKIVFNGSNLGKQYSAKAILERTGQMQQVEQMQEIKQGQFIPTRQPEQKPERLQDPVAAKPQERPTTTHAEQSESKQQTPVPTHDKNPLEILIQPEEGSGSIAAELREEQKRKRKRKKINQ